jgi:Holliday junction resolvase RusA-like endonuclease
MADPADPVRFMLPMPPSVNALYATNWKTKRRFESERYERWKGDALEALLVTKPRPKRTAGKIAVTYMVGRPNKRRMDCENFCKACSDFLVSQNLIDDDCDIDLLTVGWTDDHPGMVGITIRPAT